jgi:hypothetical protein
MKIVSFIEESDTIRRILKNQDLWKEPEEHPPPEKFPHADTLPGLIYNTELFNTLVG